MRSVASDLSIVTVTHNSRANVAQWLEAAAAVVPEAELIVVDNASTDGSADVARRHATNPFVIDSGDNLGFARGCNLGASHATRRFVWFLNPDARVQGCDAQALETALAVSPFGLVETAMVDDKGNTHFEAFKHRSIAGEYGAHVYTPLWPRAFRVNPWGVRAGIDWLSGASLLVRKEEFEHLGGFDASFFLLYEDRELSVRAKTAGLPITCIDALRVSHEIGTGSSAENLDVRRRAWAVLSWIEYLCATSGDEVGFRAGNRILRGLGRMAAIGRIAGLNRIGLKLRSAGEVRRLACELIATQRQGFYIRAARVIECEEFE